MATLTNTKIKDTYDGLLKTTDNDVIGASEKVITDGLGNASVLSIGTASASFSSDIEVNTLTIGKGANDVSTNTALGYQTLDNATGGGNTAIGYASLLADTTGVQNTAVGLSALGDNTTGSYNTALGSITLDVNTEGNHNVAVGYRSLAFNTTGQKNVAVGSEALSTQTIGSFSTAVGYEALMSQTTGSNNTAIGYASMRTSTTGTYNVAIGVASLYDNTEGSNNVAVGRYALTNSISGDGNIGIGNNSGNQLTTGSNNIYIGDNAEGSAADNDNEIVIGYNATGNGSNTATYGNTSITGHYFEGDIILTDGSNPVLSVQDTLGGSSFLKLLAGDTGTSNIYLGDDSDENAGAIVYDHSDNSMSFRTNGFLEKMSIDSSGVVVTGSVDINSNSLQLTGATNPQVLVTDTTNSVSVGLQALDASTKIDSTHSFKIEIGNDIIQSVTSSGVEITGNLAVDTNTLYVDAANNRVGINRSNPNVTFHINNPSDAAQLWITSEGANVQNRIASLEDDGADYADLLVDADEVIFRTTSTTSLQERMRIDSSGNIRVKGTNTKLAWERASDSSPDIVYLTKKEDISTNGNAKLHGYDGIVFSTAGTETERMRIDSSGNVGIGESNPTQGDLVVKGKSGAAGVVYAVGNSSSHRGEFAVEGSGQFTGGFAAVPSGASTYNGIPASTVGITTSSTPLVFATSNTERMRITSGGFLKASNSGTYAGLSSSYHELQSDQNGGMLDIRNTSGNPNIMYLAFPNAAPNNSSNYFLYAQDSSAVRCIIYSNGNIVNANNSYGSISDAKLKENVVDASPKLDDLLQVKIRNFNYIGDDKKQLGVVAQELEEVFPSMIDESPDFEEQEVIDEEGNVTTERVDLGTTTKSVKYSVFVPMLIKAIQELNAKVEQLESQLNA